MTAPPNQLTETPNSAGSPVNDILDAMRLSGGIFLDAEFSGDWSVQSHFVPDQCAQFFPVTGSLIGYHYVQDGTMWVVVDGVEPVAAEAGSIAVFPRNDVHRLYSSTDVETVSSQDLLDMSDQSGIVRIRHGTDGERTRLYCGFLSATSDDTPLLDHLPAVLIIRLEDGIQAEWIEASLQFALNRGHPMTTAEVGRLAELMVKSSLKAHLRSIEVEQPDWLRGLSDRHISKALTLIHRHFAEPFELDWLAREVGLSRSTLQERFQALMGDSPMRYCARWRLRHAAHLLRETEFNTASIAHEVGYSSEAAFSRAFRRDYGEPPSTWRKRKAGQLAAHGSLTN